ncbi:hypothetical protein M2323_000933 [Rhodoblastus acidophilus]|uniref:hypothetical protein n=1 Tax=Rhodoblastus acidophilus TaxID=1074 RepID=UPI0022256D3F|nr:hypothetical protein [Rhodoblastus acidophilus]MCW2283163.1 hypothetical protein [Rhodoblastus acidophilus]MCW2332024.1 hypothetical protein [Rhodoblastus acidophilus]
MFKLRDPSIDLINDGKFRIVDPGPLHAPICGFSIARDIDFSLTLETEASADAKSTSVEHPSGTVRLNTEKVELVNDAGIKAVMSGVQPHSYIITDYFGPGVRKETSRVHLLTVETAAATAPAYTIEWLQNVPSKPFVWPDLLETLTEPGAGNGIEFSEKGLRLFDQEGRQGFSRNSARVTIAGHHLCACSLDRPDDEAKNRPGIIVYAGIPDDLTRKKIRTALGFALGSYLVETGHTIYDHDWRIVSASVRSAYSLGQRAFDLFTLPLAHLSDHNWLHELGRQKLTRLLNALVEKYDDLDLGNLSWNYWHARTATVHIAPAHYGAAIEALQRSYMKLNPDKVPTTILSRAEWTTLRSAIGNTIMAASATEEQKRLLGGKVDSLNARPQRELLASVLRELDIDLGVDEDAAWRRRNSAAHGSPITSGKEVSAIRDMRLLEGLFHRMLLRAADAADAYIDYASPGHPIRPLKQPPENVVTAAGR